MRTWLLACVLLLACDRPPPPAPAASPETTRPSATPAPPPATPEPTPPSPPPDGCPEGFARIPTGTLPVAEGPALPVAGFCLGHTEVTVREYRRCVQRGGCRPALPCNDSNDATPGREDHPMNCLTFQEATDYARWAGGRLPTGAEWEYAARGSAGRTYPWGEEPVSCQRAVFRTNGTSEVPADFSPGCELPRSEPPCSRPAGNTPEGVCDLVGNVGEWVAPPEPGTASAGGGGRPRPRSILPPPRPVRGPVRIEAHIGPLATLEWELPPDTRRADVGLRVLLPLGARGPGSPSSSAAPPPPSAGPPERAAGELVFMPGGRVSVGSWLGDDFAQPVYSVVVDPFCIARTEVTVGQYRACVEAGGCTPPGRDRGCNPLTGRDDHPVNCVSFLQAVAYARWRGGALPTEAQWEYAARGGGTRTWPWGSTPDATCERVVMREPGGDPGGCGQGGTAPVCSRPLGDSLEGLCDLAGNVEEWTLDPQSWAPELLLAADGRPAPPPPEAEMRRVVRGGCWHDEGRRQATWERTPAAPITRSSHRGLRIVAPPLPGGGGRCPTLPSPPAGP